MQASGSSPGVHVVAAAAAAAAAVCIRTRSGLVAADPKAKESTGQALHVQRSCSTGPK